MQAASLAARQYIPSSSACTVGPAAVHEAAPHQLRQSLVLKAAPAARPNQPCIKPAARHTEHVSQHRHRLGHSGARPKSWAFLSCISPAYQRALERAAHAPLVENQLHTVDCNVNCRIDFNSGRSPRAFRCLDRAGHCPIGRNWRRECAKRSQSGPLRPVSLSAPTAALLEIADARLTRPHCKIIFREISQQTRKQPVWL